MPSHEVHRKLSKLILGRTHPDVDELLDSTFRISGSRHRRDPVHSVLAATCYGVYKGDPEKIKAGLLHILADRWLK